MDRLSGGAGTDTLALTSTAAAVTLSSTNITGFEVLNFTAGTADHTVTISGITGITNVNNVGSSVHLVVGVGADSIPSLVPIGISSTSKNTTVVFPESVVTGSADAVTVTVSGVTTAAQVNVNTQTDTSTVAGAIETINVVSSGSTNSITLNTNDSQGLGKIVVTGDKDITIALGANAATDAIILDASAATGKVAISAIGAGNTFAGVATGHTITGGTANDTFTLGANYIGAEATVASGTRDVINGGAGTDTISMTVARVVAASTTDQANLTSIEGLTISDAWTTGLALDITRFTDVTALKLAAMTGTSAATVKSGTAITMTSDAGTGLTTFAVRGVGTSDSVTLNMAGFDFDGVGAESTSGIETLNINTGATITNAATFAAALTMTASAGATTSIVVTGANAMTFAAAVTTGAIDASALTGILTFGAAPAGAINIKGGSAADVIIGSTAADSITGGNGADTITSGTGADSIVLTETTAAVDTIVTTEGAAPATATADVITGFTVGASGDILQIDISDTTAIADVGIVAAGDGATAIAGNLVLKAMTKGTGITLAATDEAVVITGTFADATALTTSIGTGAGIITKSAANTTTNGLVVVWNDGANTHVSVVSDAGADAAMTTAELVVTDIAILVGVLTDFNTVNLAAIA